MWQCTNCKNHNEDDAKFCGMCGTPRPAAANPANTASQRREVKPAEWQGARPVQPRANTAPNMPSGSKRIVSAEPERTMPAGSKRIGAPESAQPASARISGGDPVRPRPNSGPANAVRINMNGTPVEPRANMPAAAAIRPAPVPAPMNGVDPYDVIEAPAPRKRSRRGLIIALIIVLVLAIGAGAGVLLLESRYRKAGELYAQGQWAMAADKYGSIGWYRDSDERATDAAEAETVAAAQMMHTMGDYIGARNMLVNAGSSGTAAKALIEQTYIAEARALISKGEYEAAQAALANAGSGLEAAELRADLAAAMSGEQTGDAGIGDGAAEESMPEATASTQIGSLELPSLGGGFGSEVVTTQTTPEPTAEPVEEVEVTEAPTPEPTAEPTPEPADIDIGGGFFGATLPPMTGQQSQAVAVPESVTNAELTADRIAAGSGHTLGLMSNGAVMAVGENTYGQCDVGMWSSIVAVSAGDLHSVGLKSDGTVVTAGSNEFAQCDVGTWTGITDVEAGGHYTVGIRADGTVVATGVNMFGQCDVSGWNGITEVSAGYWHTVGLMNGGNVVAVGSNEYGQCNVGDWSGIVQVSAGRSHTVGLRADGTVVAVGDNEFGQCDVSGWTDIIAVRAGVAYTIGLKSDGTLVAAGYSGEDGRCNVGGWYNVKAIAVGGYHTIGVMADGSLAATGWNSNGACDIAGWNLN